MSHNPRTYNEGFKTCKPCKTKFTKKHLEQNVWLECSQNSSSFWHMSLMTNFRCGRAMSAMAVRAVRRRRNAYGPREAAKWRFLLVHTCSVPFSKHRQSRETLRNFDALEHNLTSQFVTCFDNVKLGTA